MVFWLPVLLIIFIFFAYLLRSVSLCFSFDCHRRS
uniref:Uncharacterized protein n=1 Tax=Arundo donax TaxID=35708 RepID=A0A0A9FKU2_ARUDO